MYSGSHSRPKPPALARAGNPTTPLRPRNTANVAGLMSARKTPAVSNVTEFRCLYTHDVYRKSKRWQDGNLRFHSFNKRLMLTDCDRRSVADHHWRRSADPREGDKVTLDGRVIVDIAEVVTTDQTDLTPLLERNKPSERPPPSPLRHSPLTLSSLLAPAFRTEAQLADGPRHQQRNVPVGNLPGARKRSSGHASSSAESPLQSRNSVPSPAGPAGNGFKKARTGAISIQPEASPIRSPERTSVGARLPSRPIELDTDSTPARPLAAAKSIAPARSIASAKTIAPAASTDRGTPTPQLNPTGPAPDSTRKVPLRPIKLLSTTSRPMLSLKRPLRILSAAPARPASPKRTSPAPKRTTPVPMTRETQAGPFTLDDSSGEEDEPQIVSPPHLEEPQSPPEKPQSPSPPAKSPARPSPDVQDDDSDAFGGNDDDQYDTSLFDNTLFFESLDEQDPEACLADMDAMMDLPIQPDPDPAPKPPSNPSVSRPPKPEKHQSPPQEKEQPRTLSPPKPASPPPPPPVPAIVTGPTPNPAETPSRPFGPWTPEALYLFSWRPPGMTDDMISRGQV